MDTYRLHSWLRIKTWIFFLLLFKSQNNTDRLTKVFWTATMKDPTLPGSVFLRYALFLYHFFFRKPQLICRLRLYVFETKTISLYAQQAIRISENLAKIFMYMYVLSFSSRKIWETERQVSLKLPYVTLSNFIRWPE